MLREPLMLTSSLWKYELSSSDFLCTENKAEEQTEFDKLETNNVEQTNSWIIVMAKLCVWSLCMSWALQFPETKLPSSLCYCVADSLWCPAICCEINVWRTLFSALGFLSLREILLVYWYTNLTMFSLLFFTNVSRSVKVFFTILLPWSFQNCQCWCF